MLKGPVVVTGASGMVGRHLLRVLTREGLSCIASSRRQPSALPADSRWVPWDLRCWKTPAELDSLFAQATAVLHLGALVPAVLGDESLPDIFDTNVRATLALGYWARQRNIPLIYLSGSTVYANPYREHIREDDEKVSRGVGGFGLYGVSKLMAEEVLLHVAEPDAPLCILRPSSIYGCGLAANKMIMRFLSEAAAGRTIELAPPVDDRVDLIHAEDVASAILRALEREAWGVFNVGTEHPVSVLEIATSCVEAVGKGSVRVVDAPANRPPQVRFHLCCEAARRRFDFRPVLSLRAGMKLMWDDLTAGC